MLDIDPVAAIASLLIILIVQLGVVRGHIGSILDPLLYFVVSTSFALTLAVAWVDDVALVGRVVGYFAAFWFGFHFSMNYNKGLSSIKGGKEADLERDNIFPLIMTIGVLLYLAMNVVAWSISGVPVFSNDPSLQKVEAFTGGLGFVRRYNWGMGVFLFMGSIYWYLFDRSRVAVVCFLCVAMVTVLSGSKSAFLPVVFAVGLYLLKPFRNTAGATWSAVAHRGAKYVLIAAAVPMMIVFLLESDDLAAAGTSLMIRLLYFGDVMLYWGTADLRQHFMQSFQPTDYPVHLLGGILGMLRIVPYDTPLGNQFVQFSLRVGEDLSGSLGPNTPFYVKGELFFGLVFAPVYAFVVGAVVAGFRRMFVGARGPTLTRYTLLASLLTLSMALPTEDSLFMGKIFDFFLFFAPMYAIAKLLWWGSRVSGTAVGTVS